jgi:hypothetical protein
MPIIRFHKCIFFLSFFILFFRSAYGDEIYYIDNSPLLLYKTINWWYDCLPKESTKLCGKPIKCSNIGNTLVEYNEANKTLDLYIKGGFATMLSAFKKCVHCHGPSYLHCIWLDQKYLNGTAASVLSKDFSTIIGFSFSNIEKGQAKHIQSLSHDIQFILEGVIGGLSNGRIALHESGNLLKRCNRASPYTDEDYPITLKIINTCNNETIAIFHNYWQN